MGDFWASIDRKKLAINVIGYFVILGLSQAGPPMDGTLGVAIRAYIWLFPIYYLVQLFLAYRRGSGGEQ
ncbi:MAG: hypothetical protein KUG69_04020 [Marinosulfonomonas sp.]|nr:hypothetical protein [Marinosulfonomonas sp.]